MRSAALYSSIASLPLVLSSKDFIKDSRDLAIYVTRPDLRPPLFDISVHKAEKISPGYWFTAPYSNLYGETEGGERFESCQVGPHIFDNEGNLVWSGGCTVENQASTDFRAVTTEDGAQYLSFVVAPDTRGLDDDKRGVGWILDDTYTQVEEVHTPNEYPRFNLHEFNLIENGTTAIMITSQYTETDVSVLGRNFEKGWVMDDGFVEMHIKSGHIRFSWSSIDHITVNNSVSPVPEMPGDAPGWDFIHMNSVDKNANGDYLVSGRHTCTIYKVSGKTGDIMWQLGGAASSFEMDFTFSYQHDARWHFENESMALISFLDNSGTPFNWPQMGDRSSGKLVKLDLTTMEATLIQQWDRPEGRRTDKRGNVQLLDNNNVFIGWSDNGCISEYDVDGELVLNAEFASHRFATYRTYKFDFVGHPTEPPTLKSFVFGTTPSAETTSTVFYVSWNGATEVRHWRFYGKLNETDDWTVVACSKKTGFETQHVVNGYIQYVMVEGLSFADESLGNSTVEETITPPQWASLPAGTDSSEAINGTGTGLGNADSSSSITSVDDLHDEEQTQIEINYKLSKEVSRLQYMAAESMEWLQDLRITLFVICGIVVASVVAVMAGLCVYFRLQLLTRLRKGGYSLIGAKETQARVEPDLPLKYREKLSGLADPIFTFSDLDSDVEVSDLE